MKFKQAMACLMGAMLFSAGASAATIYEPVQYQFGSHPTYYYSGENSNVHADVYRHNVCLQYGPGTPSDNFIFRADPTPIVYSDCAPYLNLAPYGFSATDARNEAYANVPRYFRKGDLLRAARTDEAGNRIITAQTIPAPRIEIRATHPDTRPAQPILIIPKRLLDKPAGDRLKVATAK